MDMTSLGSMYKTLFVPLLPFIKKVFYFDSFFSLSDEKKAEGISFLTGCVKKRDALEKYQQELKFAAFKMTASLELNDYTLRYYLSGREKYEGFCKSIFNMQSLYYFHDSQLVIKRSSVWAPLFMLIAALVLSRIAFCSVIALNKQMPEWFFNGLKQLSVGPEWLLDGLVWLSVVVEGLVALQLIVYAVCFFIGLRRLKRHVTEFNIFISRLRIKRALQQ